MSPLSKQHKMKRVKGMNTSQERKEEHHRSSAVEKDRFEKGSFGQRYGKKDFEAVGILVPGKTQNGAGWELSSV